MSWVGASVGMGAVSAIGGLFGSKSAKKQQKQAIELQRQGLAFAKQQYADNQALYGGLNKDVVAQAQEGVKADLQGVSDRAAADVATQYSGIGAALQRNQARMGINPNSGRAESQMRSTALSQALASAGGITRARETERTSANEQTWNRKFGVYQTGLGQINNSTQAVTNANNNLANGYQNMANSTAQGAAGLMAAGGQLITSGLASKFGKPATTPTDTGMNNTTSGVYASQAKTFAYPSINNAPLVSTPMANTTLNNSNYFNQNGEPF